jgi:hypothetical protein
MKMKGVSPKEKTKNERLIDENLTTRLNLGTDISKQIAALASLTN